MANADNKVVRFPESPVSRLVTLYNLLLAHEGAPACGPTVSGEDVPARRTTTVEAPAVPPSFEAMMAAVNRRGRRRG